MLYLFFLLSTFHSTSQPFQTVQSFSLSAFPLCSHRCSCSCGEITCTSFVPSSDTNKKKDRKHRRRRRRRRRRARGLPHSSFPLSVFNYLPLLPTYLDFPPCFSTCLSGSPSFLPTYLSTCLPCLPTHNFHLPEWLSFLLTYLPCLPTDLFYLAGCLSFLPTYLVFLPTFSTYPAASPSYLPFTLTCLPTHLPTSLLFLPTVCTN
jgi:hypothetical protein